MATAISNSSIKAARTQLATIQTNINKWEGQFSIIEGALSGDVGKTFAEGYPAGANACSKMKEIVSLLKEMKSTVATTISATDEFLDQQQSINNRGY